MSVTYITGAILLIITWIGLHTLRQYCRLRHIPGPPSAGFSKWWLARAVQSGRTHLDLYEVCRKYGMGSRYEDYLYPSRAAMCKPARTLYPRIDSIARVGPKDLITSDPDLMKHMLNDNALSARDDTLHGNLRSKMASGYSGKELNNLEAKIDQNVLALINLLEKNYISLDKPFDFGRKAQYFTLDVISELAFGEPFGDVATDSDVHEYIATSELNMPSVMLTTVFPWSVAVLKMPLFSSMLPSEKDAVGIGRTMAIAKKVASARFGPHKEVRRDMLGSFISRGLTQSEAESEIMMQILAGSDTTATAIRATLLHIITNSRVVHSLLLEIKDADPSWPVVSDVEARAMPYLQAVIREGLRIWPPVVGLMSKEVPRGADTFKGVFLPEGTRIGYCAWGIFRREDIWGEGTDEFRPERWIEASPERLKKMDGTLDLIFGYGRWQCLGRNVAHMELNKIFVELLRRYDLSLVNPSQPWKSQNFGIFLQSEYWIRGYPRKGSTSSIFR